MSQAEKQVTPRTGRQSTTGRQYSVFVWCILCIIVYVLIICMLWSYKWSILMNLYAVVPYNAIQREYFFHQSFSNVPRLYQPFSTKWSNWAMMFTDASKSFLFINFAFSVFIRLSFTCFYDIVKDCQTLTGEINQHLVLTVVPQPQHMGHNCSPCTYNVFWKFLGKKY